VLEREPDIRVLGEAGTPSQAMAVLATTRPTIVLLDPRLLPSSEAQSINLCATLHPAYPDVPVLVLVEVIDDQLVLDAIRAGARGCLVKEIGTAELVRTVRAVSRGESVFDLRTAAAMVRGIEVAPTAERRQLTRREREVLRLLARGLTNRAIGKQLYIAETTAKFHVGNIMRKLEVTRRAAAVYIASRAGVI
jgi:two-component system, NarL family, response regulator DevR